MEVHFKIFNCAKGFESSLNFRQNRSFMKSTPTNDSVGITGLDCGTKLVWNFEILEVFLTFLVVFSF